MLNKIWETFKAFFVAIANIILIVITFGTKRIQKSFSIEAYEMDLNNMKTKKQNMQKTSLDVAIECGKNKSKKEAMEAEYKTLLADLNKSIKNGDIVAGNVQKIKLESLKKCIDDMEKAIENSDKYNDMIRKQIELMEFEIVRQTTKLSELKMKNATRKSLDNINSIIRNSNFNSETNMNMKDIADNIDEDLLSSTVENKVLLDNIPTTESSEFSSIEDMQKFYDDLTGK